MRMIASTMLAVAIDGLASPAAADSIADFYKGKTVTIIVGYPPASGYTLYAQMLAKYLADHMPGRPNVIVQSMPGAGCIKAANYVYTVAPKDGTTLGMLQRRRADRRIVRHVDDELRLRQIRLGRQHGRKRRRLRGEERVGRAQVRGPVAEGDAVRRHRPVRRRDAGGDRADAALWRQDQADQGLSRRAGRGAGDGPRRGAGRLRHHHRRAQEPAARSRSSPASCCRSSTTP